MLVFKVIPNDFLDFGDVCYDLPFSLLILLICGFSLLILVRFSRGLSILFIFSKSQLFVSLILCTVFLALFH
jgi:hypothetical protein